MPIDQKDGIAASRTFRIGVKHQRMVEGALGRDGHGEPASPPGFVNVRCQQKNGEIDVLDVTVTGFGFYEVGCDVSRPVRTPGAVRFAAQCYYKGAEAL